MWCSHSNLHKIIEHAWDNSSNFHEAIQNFEKDVIFWNKQTFKNIFKKQKNILQILEGIQNSSNYPRSVFLLNLEQSLILDYNILLKQEEEFWKLKSRIDWLSEGDANFKFFHTTTLIRRRKNRIRTLQLEDNSWIEDQDQILAHIKQYYHSLSKSAHQHSKNYIPSLGPIHLSYQDKERLGLAPLDAEISKVVHSFKPLRAPGSDGLHPFFYQKYWHIVGPSVICLCKKAFSDESILETINRTHVCLISKTKNATSLKNFCPISLCNLSYKIITKIISTRLKHMMPLLLGLVNQASFRIGKQLTTLL